MITHLIVKAVITIPTSKGEYVIHGCNIDASKIMSTNPRPIIVVDIGDPKTNKLRMERCHFKSNPSQPPTSGLFVNTNTNYLNIIA